MAWIFNPFSGTLDWYLAGAIAVLSNALLLESGSYLLLENGSKLLLEG